MNISSLFIRRPVMTTLVMAGILLFGAVAYKQLPVSDLPAVDYPTISVGASLPGASAETMASSVATPLEKQFSTIAGIDQNVVAEQPGADVDHAAVHARPQYRRRCPGRAVGDRQDAEPAPAGDDPAVIREGGPVVCADPLSGAPFHDASALAARRVRRDLSRATHLDGRGGRAGPSLRLAEVRRAHPARPGGAGRAQDRDRRGRGRRFLRQRESPHRRALGERQGVHSAGERATRDREGVRPAHRRVPQWRAGASAGPRPSRRRRAGQQGRELVQRHARDRARRPAATRHEHRGRCGSGERSHEGARDHLPRVGHGRDALRPVGRHPERPSRT